MSNEKISEEQLKEILEKNPEFTEKLTAQKQIAEASSTPVKVFKTYQEAYETFKFLEPTETEVSKFSGDMNFKNFGSGIINGRTQFIQYLTGKNAISFPLSFVLAEEANGKNRFKYVEKFTILRILLVKQIDNTVTTIEHVDPEDMVHAGKHFLHIFNAAKYIEGHAEDSKYDIYINATPDDKYIKVDTNMSDDLVNSKETFYIVPIVISKSILEETLTSIEKIWDSNKDDFISKLVEGYKDEEKTKLKDAILKVTDSKCVQFGNITVNSGFSKGMALYYLHRNEISPIQDGITDNSGDADYLNIVSNLYPKYGEEYIDLSNIELDERGMPILSKNDLKCLKIVGVTEELAKNIYMTGIQSLESAEKLLPENEIDNARISEIANAECRLIVDLDGDNWVEAMNKTYDSDVSDYSLMLEKAEHESRINDAQKTIYDIKQQFAVLQKTAKRIEMKINSGEFSNIYMVLCNNYFNSLYKNTFDLKDDDVKNISMFPMLLHLFNEDYHNNKEFIDKKIKNTVYNTFNCNVSKDKYGNPVDNLFDKFASVVDDFIDLDAVPANLSADEQLKALMDQVFIRFKYIDSISKTPYRFIIKLCPDLVKAFSSTEPKIDLTEKSKKYYSELGFDGPIDVTESMNLEQYEYFHDIFIKLVRQRIKIIKKDYLDYLKVLNENRSKNRMDKARIFAKFAVYFTLYAYIESIDSGLSPIDDKLSDDEIKQDVYMIKDSVTDKEISKEDYISLDETKRKSYNVFKKLSTEEVDDLITDFMLRIIFLSKFIIHYSRVVGKYEDNLLKVNSNEDLNANARKMFVSELGLCVPSIAAMEYPNFIDDESKNNEVDFDSIIPIESKIKLGTTAVNEVLKDLDNPEKLIYARKKYFTISYDYVRDLLDFISSGIETEIIE